MKTQGGTLYKTGKRRTSMKISMKISMNSPLIYKKETNNENLSSSPKFPQIPQNSKTMRNFIIFTEILGV